MGKTAAERMKAMRARNKEKGLKQLRIYAPAELHEEIKTFAENLIQEKGGNMSSIRIDFTKLNEKQKDGISCCVCDSENKLMKPVSINENQLFVCCKDPKSIHP